MGHSNGGATEGRAGGGAEEGRPSRNESPGCDPGIILKLQMRNSALRCLFSPVLRVCDLPPVDRSHAHFEGYERPRESPRKIGVCGGLEPKKLNISMYVVCAHCILQLFIDSVIVTNKHKMQINVLYISRYEIYLCSGNYCQACFLDLGLLLTSKNQTR